MTTPTNNVETWRADLPSYAHVLSRGLWRPTRTHVAIARCIQREAFTPGSITVFNMPTRHGKSLVTSEWLPDFYLNTYPARQVILSSYQAKFASRWGRKVRDRIEGDELSAATVRHDVRAAHDWELVQGGGMVSVGVGGPIVGRGFSLGIIDDPHKNWAEATSETHQRNTWDWFRSTFMSRAEEGASVIINQMRWCKGDLTDRILSSDEFQNVKLVRLPAIAEDDDPLGRQPGEALAPEIVSLEWLEEQRRRLGSYMFDAIYQQNPHDAEGAIWATSWFRFWDVLPSGLTHMCQVWDPKGMKEGGGSYVCGQVWGRLGANLYLVDQWRTQKGMLATMEQIKAWRAKYPTARRIYVEAAADGPGIIQTLRQSITGMIPITPQGSKVARAVAAQPTIEGGNVYIPTPDLNPWVRTFLAEVEAFPTGKLNDQIDTTAHAINVLEKSATSSGIKPEFYRL